MVLTERWRRTQLLVKLNSRRGDRRTQRIVEREFQKALQEEYRMRFYAGVAYGGFLRLYLQAHANRPVPRLEIRRSYRMESWRESLAGYIEI